MFHLGGRQGKIANAAFEVFDFGENKWKKLPDIPSKRVFPSYAATEKYIFSVGGLNQNPQDGFSDAMEVFDLEKGACKLKGR